MGGQQILSSSNNQFSSGSQFLGGSRLFGSNSAFAAPNVNYGTPLSFTDFNTPAPVLTYGAPNFGPSVSYVSTSSDLGAGLYSSLGNSALTTTYGTPVIQQQGHAGHDCSLHAANQNIGHIGSFETSAQHGFGSSGSGASSSSFSNSLSGSLGISGGSSGLNSGVVGSTIFYDTPAVNELSLQLQQQKNVDLKDSYGNPIGVSYGVPSDQSTAALTSNDIHISSSSSSASTSDSSSSALLNSFSNQFQVNSLPLSGNYLTSPVSAEALTAALTAQGYGSAKHAESGGVDASHYLETNEGSEALALAQGLTASGTNGFQIQGSKGTYSLQIQPADGGLGTENSDGSIRHEQVLSNGLLQDILAAIEQPENGQVQIQGAPQGQRLEEIYGDLAHAASGNIYEHDHNLVQNIVQRTVQSEERAKPAVDESEENDRTDRKTDASSGDSETSATKDDVALFFKTNFDETKKDTRSLDASESKSKSPEAAASSE